MSYFVKSIDTEKLLESNTISSGEKTIYTLLVTYKLIIKLQHYI